MHGDAALSEEIRLRVLPRSRLRGEANLLVMPTLDAANIAFNLLKTASGGGVTIGPILLGAARPVHILTPSATVRRVVNMTAVNAATLAVFADNFSRAVGNLLEVWEHMRCEHIYRTDAWRILKSGARWLGAMMLISRNNPVSLLDNEPLARMLEKNLDFQRIQ